MNRRIAFIAACALLLAAPYAQAQSDMKLRMDSGFYMGAGVGRGEQRDFCTEIVGGTCDAKDLTWSLFAGYQFNRYAAVEAGYVDLGKATASGFTVAGGLPAAISSRSKAWELLGVLAMPLNDAFSLYGKFGCFYYDTDGIGSGANFASTSDSGTEITFGFGAEYNINRNVGARLEWQRYMSVGSGIFNFPKGDISVLRFATRYRF